MWEHSHGQWPHFHTAALPPTYHSFQLTQQQLTPSEEKLKTVWVFSQTLQLFLIFFGTGFEVLTVTRIYSVVWIRTPYRLVNGHVRFGGAIWA
jgi:hypothetical protein